MENGWKGAKCRKRKTNKREVAIFQERDDSDLDQGRNCAGGVR